MGLSWGNFPLFSSLCLDCLDSSTCSSLASICDKGLSGSEVVEVKVRKPGQLTDQEKAILKEQLRAGCRNIGANSIYNAPGMHPRENFGLCHDCGHFCFAATQYRIRVAACEQREGFLIPLYEDDPILECSSYYQRGEQDAHDYSKNAWLLDPAEKKVGII